MDIKNLPIPPGGALYEPDERDYDGERDGIDISTLPPIAINDDGITQDQNKAGYPMGCVHFASSMNDNYSNKRDDIDKRSTGEEVLKASPTFSPTAGDFNYAGPRALKKLGLIEGYFNINSLESVMYQIAHGNILHTGSNKINWSATYRNNFVVPGVGTGSGHAFQIIGYNNTDKPIKHWHFEAPAYSLICKNSYDTAKYFYIRFEHFEVLHWSKYYFVNTQNPIMQYKKDILKNLTHKSAKLTFLAGIWNGQEPKKDITREDINVMIKRALEKNGFDFSQYEKELEDLEK